MAKVGERLKHAWNAFSSPRTEPDVQGPRGVMYTGAYGHKPDRSRLSVTNERSIISAIYTRIGVDVASIDIRHTRTDEQGRFMETMASGLNNCLTLEANIDQASRAFLQDIVMSLLDTGVIAIVPIDTSVNPLTSGGYNILTMRVGRIVSWFPQDVRVDLFNEKTGNHQEVTVPKSMVAIVENPLYSVMNEPNSTLTRLVQKLILLDAVDKQSSSGKLDIIIQLPYTIKSDARREQARQRREDLEFQLKDSQYGVAYADATEKITQLNRPAENNLMNQIEYLTDMLYGQLGLTREIMNGTADETAMLNYWNRTIEPITAAITQAMERTFLTKTARSQGQKVQFFRDPFKLIPLGQLAEIADKFSRNEILTSNEIRQIVGRPPSSEPKADKLANPNMPIQDTGTQPPQQDPTSSSDSTTPGDTPQN